MMILGVAVAVIAAFIASSVYYAVLSPVEAKAALADQAPYRGSPRPWQVATELVRTALVAGGFSWVAGRADLLDLPGVLGLALVLWLTFPAVILLGSVTWERVPPVTAGLHTGDWLLKLVLVATAVGLLH